MIIAKPTHPLNFTAMGADSRRKVIERFRSGGISAVRFRKVLAEYYQQPQAELFNSKAKARGPALLSEARMMGAAYLLEHTRMKPGQVADVLMVDRSTIYHYKRQFIAQQELYDEDRQKYKQLRQHLNQSLAEL